MPQLSIIFAGAGEFGLPALRALIDAGHKIVQVVSQPDRESGRGRKLTPTLISRFAIEHNLPLIRTANINVETLPPADAMVVIAFGQKIGEKIVRHPRLGSVNLHASRLPKFRGAAPIHAAILSGETITGNSIIRLAQKMDAGAVLGMSEVRIGELETTGELHDRLAEDGASLMLRVLADLATGRATESPQDESLASVAPKLSKSATEIDWTRPANQIARQIRAMHPWPACRVRLIESEKVVRATLVRARAIPSHNESSPGQIELTGAIHTGAIHTGAIHTGAIHTGTGAVEVIEIQPEGGRIMPLADFRNGHLWKPGIMVESIL